MSYWGAMDMADLDSNRRGFSASIRHLRLFESVAQLQGVRRASEECHLSQPAVTQAIAKLEEQLGVQLLLRCATGSYLNEFGIIFHARTQRFFMQVEHALLELGVPSSPFPLARVASRITRSQIRSLLAIVENGTFAQAARALGVSQTSLQRAARDLERTLRTPLYIQTAAGIMAAPGAAEFARKIKVAQREIDLGVDELEAARGNVSGEIVIGALLLAGSAVLASVINELAATYPTANIRILNGNAEDVLRYLRNGDVDVVIGLLRNPSAAELVHEVLAETPYLVVGRHHHPFMRREQLTLDDLADCEWVIGTPGANRRVHFENMFAGRRRPQSRIATCSLPIIRPLLTQSDRLTLLTNFELMHEEDVLAALPFGPIEPVPSIGLTMRQNWLPTQLQAQVIDLIRQRIVKSLGPLKELQQITAVTDAQRKARPIAVS
jgi:LysR family transcriptional regulator of gallate degradation